MKAFIIMAGLAVLAVKSYAQQAPATNYFKQYIKPPQFNILVPSVPFNAKSDATVDMFHMSSPVKQRPPGAMPVAVLAGNDKMPVYDYATNDRMPVKIIESPQSDIVINNFFAPFVAPKLHIPGVDGK
jgi:hypothetical protein